MLPPAGRLAGRSPAFTVKALVEVLTCATCTADVPWFVIDRVRETGVPTFTSPKSIVDGLTTSAGVLALEVVDEKALESEPQPERPMLSAIAVDPSTRTQTADIRPSNLCCFGVTFSRPRVIFPLIPKNKILRNSHIDITCAKESGGTSQP